MVSGSILTNDGKKIIINRAYKASPDYLIPTQFKVGVDSSTPNIGDNDLDVPVPISNGDILLDGSLTLDGAFGGEATSGTTTRYKEGAGTNDATSQELLSNATSGTKHWSTGTLTNVWSGTSTGGFWMYVADSTTLNKIKNSGTAVQARFGSGTDTNFYYKEWTQSQLSTGWNLMTTGTAIGNLGMSGSVDGKTSSFALEVISQATTDVFSSGSLFFDLLRQWQLSDETKDWSSGTYPEINESTFVVEMRGELATTEANGFDVDSFGSFNKDSDTKISGKDVFTSESKSSTDKFTFVIQDRIN
jgi:hypothetical protein